jgi:hypothetical protein
MTALPPPWPEILRSTRTHVSRVMVSIAVFIVPAVVAGILLHSVLVWVLASIWIAFVTLPIVLVLTMFRRDNRAWLDAFAADPTRLVWIAVDGRSAIFHDYMGKDIHVFATPELLAEAVRIHGAQPGVVVTDTPAATEAHKPIAWHAAQLVRIERELASTAQSPAVRELGAPFHRWHEAWQSEPRDEAAREATNPTLADLVDKLATDRIRHNLGLVPNADEIGALIARLPRTDPLGAFRG